MTDEPYGRVGLAASQLETLLQREAEGLAGTVVGVACAGRGGVLWHAGELRLVGPVGAEFVRAIDALLDEVDRSSARQVRQALLSMGGARLVIDRLGAPRLQ